MSHSWGEHRGEKGGQKGDRKGDHKGKGAGTKDHKGGQKGDQKGDHKGDHKGKGAGTKGHKGGKKGGYQTSDDLMSCTCIFMEGNKYFLEDVFGATKPVPQLRYLLGLATAAGRTEALQVPVTGELCREAEQATEEASQRWPENDLRRALIPVIPKEELIPEEYPFKLKVLLLAEGAENSRESLEVLQHLLRLQFCHGPISVFKVELPRSVRSAGLTADYHQDILNAHAMFVRTERERLSMQPADAWHVQVAGKSHFLRCAVICPVFYSRQGEGGDLYPVAVWDRERGREVKYPGGDICHQRDRDLIAAARREFLEEPRGTHTVFLPFDFERFVSGNVGIAMINHPFLMVYTTHVCENSTPSREQVRQTSLKNPSTFRQNKSSKRKLFTALFFAFD